MSILPRGHKYSLSCRSGTLFDTSYNSHCKHFWGDFTIWGQEEITECKGVSRDVTMDAVVTIGVSRDVTIEAIVANEGPSWFLCECPSGPLGSRRIIEECPSEPLGCRRIIWKCPSEPRGQGSWPSNTKWQPHDFTMEILILFESWWNPTWSIRRVIIWTSPYFRQVCLALICTFCN